MPLVPSNSSGGGGSGSSGTLPAALGQTTMAGSLPVVLASDESIVSVSVGAALPAGTNVIGHVIVDTLPALPTGANVIGHVIVDTLPALPAGANTIGAVTFPAAQHVIPDSLPALVAGTALAGRFGAFMGVGQVIDSTGVARAVTSTFVNVAASQTDSVIVALSGATVVYVLAVAMVTGGTATNVTFNSKPAGAGAAISPLFANAANGGAVLPFNGMPWFQSSASQGLSVTTGGGSTTGILVLYAQF